MPSQKQDDRTGARSSWMLCPGCRRLVFHRTLARTRGVCADCGHHFRLPAPQRIEQLLDDGSAEPLDFRVETADPLGFVDSTPYPQRLRRARVATGLAEAVLCVRGRIGGNPVIAAVMDFRFMGGSLGAAVGELVTLAAELALAERTPLLIVSASGGARMQEGALALMQMAKTAAALSRLDEAGVLTLSLVTDPTFGGVAASYATLCDVVLAEPGARLGFAGSRVIRQTIGQRLPEGFQTAEFLLARGLIDGIHRREELAGVLGRLLATATPAPPPAPADGGLIRDCAQLPAEPSWDVVQRARDVNRPSTMDYIGSVFEDFLELRGDRAGGDCVALLGGVARLDGAPVLVLGHRKGHTAAELAAHNFGMATPAGYRKAMRLMRLAGKLGIPVITLIDTPGAFPGVEAEEQGQAGAIAESIRLMATLPVPVVAVVTGEGGSGGALALGVANTVLAFPSSTYSVISPEGCAAILWGDPAEARRAAEALRPSARELLSLGVLDAVIPEPAGGPQADHRAAAGALRRALRDALADLGPLGPGELIDHRRRRFRAFGLDSWEESSRGAELTA
ncbi:acetyl-CoA carboxylase, carboxyltransferase subunit beta [Amycolatopsis anabasis]|uniref:acetyl-CoA carboxylase, carboxyltransferase subunit beta n=1 Tax=Amycolatopsis anabasis TaxID=1840409 RepID=UPI00131D276C|nr:acetyl-CoA carboxylase, carboxyltransferase subunit beta [Amycolatopsis anabasis]